MVYELYGCPGCGKSTVVKETEQFLHEIGIKYLNYYDVFFDGNSSLRHRLFYYLRSIFDPSSVPLNYHIAKTCIEFKCPIKYAVYLMTLCRRIRIENSKSEDTIILLDEGIIQFITSLSHGKDISTYNSVIPLVRHILSAGITIRAVECVLPLHENIKRLTGRLKSSRFLEVKDEDELLRLLTEKKKNLDYVASLFEKLIKLEMTAEPRINAQLLLNEIINASAKQ